MPDKRGATALISASAVRNADALTQIQNIHGTPAMVTI
jgi:hypothetical protein